MLPRRACSFEEAKSVLRWIKCRREVRWREVGAMKGIREMDYMMDAYVQAGRKARGAEQAGEDDSSRHSEGSDLVNGLFWTRGEMARSCK